MAKTAAQQALAAQAAQSVVAGMPQQVRTSFALVDRMMEPVFGVCDAIRAVGKGRRIEKVIKRVAFDCQVWQSRL